MFQPSPEVAIRLADDRTVPTPRSTPTPVTKPDTRPTLAEFLDAIPAHHDFLPVYRFVVSNHREFIAGDVPIKNELSIIREGEDIVYPVLDAITFGILREQETPSYYRTDPTNSHFGTVRQFDSTDGVIDSQTEQLASYFRYVKENHGHSLEEDIDPPDTTYLGVELSGLLHHPIIFGEQLEMWDADGLVEEHGDSPVSMEF